MNEFKRNYNKYIERESMQCFNDNEIEKSIKYANLSIKVILFHQLINENEWTEVDSF